MIPLSPYRHPLTGGLPRVLAGLAALLWMAGAQAYFEVFDDRQNFIDTATDLTDIDFNHYAPEDSYRNYSNSGLTVGDVHFTGTDNYLYVVDDAYSPIYYDWGSDAILLGYKGGTITATFAAGVNAVGSDFMALVKTGYNTYDKVAADFTVTLSDGSSYSVSSEDYPDRAFFGIVSDEFTITSIAFHTNSNNAYVKMDNFIYGDYEATTEVGGGGGGGGPSGTGVPAPGVPLLMLPALAYLLRRAGRKT